LGYIGICITGLVSGIIVIIDHGYTIHQNGRIRFYQNPVRLFEYETILPENEELTEIKIGIFPQEKKIGQKKILHGNKRDMNESVK
jgi:hypothetical protein